MNIRKITIATGIYPPDIGGPALYASRFAEEFLRRGIAVAVVAYGAPSQAVAFSVSGVSRAWPKGIRHCIYLVRLFFAAIGSDAVFAFDSLGAGLPALIVSSLLRKRLVVRLGGDFLWEKYVNAGHPVTLRAFYDRGLYWVYPFLFRCIGFVLRHADMIIFTTTFQRDIFVRYYALPVSRVRVIANVFTKVESGKCPPERPKPFGRAWKVESGRTLLWAGRMIPLKNLPLLVRVFQQLRAVDSSLRLRIVGDGPDRQMITALIVSLNLSDSVVVLPAVNEATLDQEIRNACCVVVPSLTEISPNFILRSLALGVPVVVTAETGIRDQFPQLIFIDPEDEHGFFLALQRLFLPATYAQYRQMIVAIPSGASWSTVADQYLAQIYQQ